MQLPVHLLAAVLCCLSQCTARLLSKTSDMSLIENTRTGVRQSATTTINAKAHLLDSLDLFLTLEHAHGAHHIVDADPTLPGGFGCVFRSYWTKIIQSCDDGSLHSLPSPIMHHGPLPDIHAFCNELKHKCTLENAPIVRHDDPDTPVPPLQPEPMVSLLPVLYPVPWVALPDIVPEALSWITIATDEGIPFKIDLKSDPTTSRWGMPTTIAKDVLRVTYGNTGHEGEDNSQLQMEDIPWASLADRVHRPESFPETMTNFEPTFTFDETLSTDKAFYQNDYGGSDYPSQLEPFVFDPVTKPSDKSNQEKCESSDIQVQEECISDVNCRCEDPLIWLRVVKKSQQGQKHRGRPQCLTAAKDYVSTKWGSLEVEDCSDSTLWVVRKSKQGKGGPDVTYQSKRFGRGKTISANYQLISVGDSRDSNGAGTAIESVREPARCLVKPKCYNPFGCPAFKVQAIRAAEERSCVLNPNHPNPDGKTMDDCQRLVGAGWFSSADSQSERDACENAFPRHTAADTEEEKIDDGSDGNVCVFQERPNLDTNYCNHGGTIKWDIKTNGIVCEDGCLNCLNIDKSEKDNKDAITHCFSPETSDPEHLVSVVDYAKFKKNHPFRDDPFETLEYDLPTIKEAARRALGRYTLGMSSVGYFKTLQELLHNPIGATAEEKATQAEELREVFQAFLKFFTSAKTKVSDYEHPKRMEEWNGSRLDISKRFSKAGIAPKGHPWCPQVCSTVLAQSPTPMARTDVPEGAAYAKLVQWATERDDGKKDDDDKEDALAHELAVQQDETEEEVTAEEGQEDEGVTDESLAQNIQDFTALASVAAVKEQETLLELWNVLQSSAEQMEEWKEGDDQGKAVFQMYESVKEAIQVYTTDEQQQMYPKYPTTWTYAMCQMSDCYSGVGDERALLQAKARSEDQYKDSTALSMDIRKALLDNSVTTLGHKTLLKMCEIRYRKPKWWESRSGGNGGNGGNGGGSSGQTALLALQQRHASHINMLVEATDEALYEMLPSLEKLTPERLKIVCEAQEAQHDSGGGAKSGRKAKHYKAEKCMTLSNPYYCHVNKAIIELVPKNQCNGGKEPWCAFKQSMIVPCLYADCLDPQEQKSLPVRCEESMTSYGLHKEWVCGYRASDSSDKCDCNEMRSVESGLVHRMFLKVADFMRKNAFMIAQIGAVLLATGICLAFPACMAMMGVQSTAVSGTADTMSAMSETFGCGKEGANALIAKNPGVSAAGGGWYGADKLWSRPAGGRLVRNDGWAPMMGLEDTAARGANAAKFLSRGIMSKLPSWVPTSDTARQVKDGMKVLGTSHPGMAFNPNYIKANTVISIPPSCANFGKGVNYLQASAKIAGKFMGVLQTANAVFKVGKQLVNFLKTVGVKSYAKEFKTDPLFLSSTPLQLQRRTNPAQCLGLVEGEGETTLGWRACSHRTNTLWRSEDRQKDDKPDDAKQRLYQITKSTTTRGDMTTDYYLDKGIGGGFGPGKCITENKSGNGAALHIKECTDSIAETDFELKNNGMLCFDECRKCLVANRHTGAFEIKKCGVAKQTSVTMLWGGGEYDLVDRLVKFNAVAAVHNKGAGFKEIPTPLEFRKCNWMADRETFINDYWPLVAREQLCNGLDSCGYDVEEGWCKVLNWKKVDEVADGAASPASPALPNAQKECTTEQNQACGGQEVKTEEACTAKEGSCKFVETYDNEKRCKPTECGDWVNGNHVRE